MGTFATENFIKSAMHTVEYQTVSHGRPASVMEWTIHQPHCTTPRSLVYMPGIEDGLAQPQQ